MRIVEACPEPVLRLAGIFARVYPIDIRYDVLGDGLRSIGERARLRGDLSVVVQPTNLMAQRIGIDQAFQNELFALIQDEMISNG